MPEKKSWSERYLSSDHHTDRLVNTVVNYERASGLDIADPDKLYEEAMARGRPGSDRYHSRASVSRHRAASVPVGTGRDPNLSTFIRAQDISSGVMDDSGAISSASKWRDQQLLNNISHTLRSAGIHDTKPYPSYEPRPRPREQDCYDPSRVGARCRSVEPANKKFGSGYDENQFKRNEKRLPSEIVEEAMKLLGGREERQRLASKSSSSIVDSIYSLAGARGSSSAPLTPKVDETSEYVASILRSAEERARGNNDMITRVVSTMPNDYDNDSLYYNDEGTYDDYIPLTNRGLYHATYDDTSRYNDDDDEDDVEVVYIDGRGHSMLPSRAMYSGLSDAMKAANSGYYPTSVPASRSRQHSRRASVASVQRYAHRRNSVANEPVLSQVPTPYTTQAFRSARLRSRASSVPPVPTYAASETPARKAAIYSSLMDASTSRPHSYAGGTGRGYIQVDSPLLRMAGGAARPIETLRREAPGYVHRSYQMKPDYASGYSHTAPVRRSVVPAGNSASCGLAVRQARQCLGRLERELGVDDMGSSPYSYTDDSYAIEAPLASPIVVPTRVTSGRAYSRTTAPRRYSFSGPTSTLSSAPVSSYTPNYYTTPSISAAQNKITSIESQLELGSLHNEYTSAPVPYSALRSATVDARNKIDRHKTMLDRYLPINMGPENDVGYEVDYKYGQIADRIPQLEPYKPKTVAVTSSMVAPYRPVAKAGRDLCEAAKPPMASFRPEVSETRKRCREVLCKIKGDPRYYD